MPVPVSVPVPVPVPVSVRVPAGRRLTRELLFRLLALVALLQPAAPTVAAVLDAWYDNGALAVAHAESQSSTDCIRVHADNCALCSIVVAFQSAPPDVAPPHDTRTPHTVPADQVAIGSALVVPNLPPTRAPPLSART